MQANKIGFIGLGLIGGSIAKAIKKYYPNTHMIALASREQTLQLAYADGVIENNTFIPLDEFASCDIIFLCSPVKINVDYLQKLKPLISQNCLITDVGSVKGDISRAVLDLGLTSQFIGGHPMAGAENTGFENASTTLLENAYYILTHTKDVSAALVQDFSAYITSLGPLTLIMSPDDHDFATACISHLPHIIASSLVNYVAKADSNETLKTIAAGGFRDITRIASSSPIMWQHICETNQTEILHAATLFQSAFSEFITLIEHKQFDQIYDLLTSAKDYRDNLPIKKAGVLPGVFEFYLDVNDEVGGIATIATILANQNLSIKNIGIVHNREFEQGVLRIEMYDDTSMEQAMSLLSQNYKIYN